MIKAKLIKKSTNKLTLAVWQGKVEIYGPLAEALKQDFKLNEELLVIVGRGKEVLPGDTAE